MPSDIAHDSLYFKQGSAFSKTWPLIDADTGGAADPTGWSARCEVRDGFGGALLTRFHSDSAHGWDGLIAFDVVGNMTLTLDEGKTVALPVPRAARFDVELVDPDGHPHAVVQGRAYVTQEVTTDA